MCHLKFCFNLGTLEVMECYTRDLTFDFCQGLHGGEVNDQESYIEKMSMLEFYGGLWGNYIAIL
jgi:hypothetical protein